VFLLQGLESLVYSVIILTDSGTVEYTVKFSKQNKKKKKRKEKRKERKLKEDNDLD